MREHFVLETSQAASESEAAFILEPKSGLRAEVVLFRTLKDLDAYQPAGTAIPIRNLPILLVAQPNDLTARNVSGILNRMANWYYYTQLNPPKPPPAGTPPAS